MSPEQAMARLGIVRGRQANDERRHHSSDSNLHASTHFLTPSKEQVNPSLDAIRRCTGHFME
jgi:hypothetical protein